MLLVHLPPAPPSGIEKTLVALLDDVHLLCDDVRLLRHDVCQRTR